MYYEKRSKHALAVDRGINAKTRYSSFNKPYEAAPNQSDVEDYDTIKKKKTIKAAPKQKPIVALPIPTNAIPSKPIIPLPIPTNKEGGYRYFVPEVLANEDTTKTSKEVAEFDTAYKSIYGKLPSPIPKPEGSIWKDLYKVEEEKQNKTTINLGFGTPIVAKTNYYQPTPTEKEKLITYFHKQPLLAQVKDLMETKNVIRKKAGVKDWKQNVKQHDIQGVDTAPFELIPFRTQALWAISDKPQVAYAKTSSSGEKQGKYQMAAQDSYRNIIYANPYLQNPKQIALKRGEVIGNRFMRNRLDLGHTIAHELGHNIERKHNTKAGILDTVTASNKSLSWGKTGALVNRYGLERTELLKISKKRRPNAYVNPKNDYKFYKYVSSDSELWADFIGEITNDTRSAKKLAPKSIAALRKHQPEILNALGKASWAAALPYTSKRKKRGKK